jgi:glycosyltransferase involved in cell wall biosynthesis
MTHPFVSFVIPTLNASELLPSCLASIRKQDYPREYYEILVADGGSTDDTAAIAEAHDCSLLDATGMMAEPAKQLAFSKSKGKYIAMIDTDNEVVETNWLSQAITALERHPDALGFESYYFKHPRHTHLNRYLTGLLQISDPCARMMASPLKLETREADGTEVFTLPADGGYPTGANGFLFPRALLEKVPQRDAYHEAAFFPALMRSGVRKLLKIPGCGVHHHYVKGWGDYMKKRRRAMIIYSLRKEEIQDTWDQGGIHFRKVWAIVYTASFIGPLLEGICRALYSRDPDWLLHPLASVISTVGNVWGVIDFRRLGSSEQRAGMSRRLGPGEGKSD